MVQATNETIPVHLIQVGERVREEMGDLAQLAQSIERFGLIHAVVVDEENRLLCGGRRLASLKSRGTEVVDVRRLSGLDETEKRLVELEENARRKDLTPYEWAKTITEKVDIAKQVAAAAEPPPCSREQGGGSRPDPKSMSSVAKAAGVTRVSAIRAERHVHMAEMYPFLQGKGWKQEAVFRAYDYLAKIDEPQRAVVVELVSEEGIGGAKDQETILETLALMDADRRQAILNAYQSDDPRDQLLAKTTALKLMPVPDVRRGMVLDARKALERARDKFPDDELVPRLNQLIGAAQQLIEEIERQDKERINAWNIESETAAVVS